MATPWVRVVAVLTDVQVISEPAFSFVTPFTPLDVQQLLGETDRLRGSSASIGVAASASALLAPARSPRGPGP